MIDRDTGALVLLGGRVGRESTRSTFLASPLAKRCRTEDIHTGWWRLSLQPAALGGLLFAVDLTFEAERLESYSLALIDARYGTSWEDWSDEKQRALRKAHDAWLVRCLGRGKRRASGRGKELFYAFAWGEAWSSFDPKGGSSAIGVRFARGKGAG
jgi:hypothetical protein